MSRTYSPATMADLRRRADIVDLIRTRVALRSVGNEFVGECLFCPADGPTFFVSPKHRVYHCHACGCGGDVVEFMRRTTGMDFPQAVDYLLARLGDTPAR